MSEYCPMSTRYDANLHSHVPHLPNHVAIIMDGNGRWAENRGLPRIAGHRAGTENIRPMVKCVASKGIKYLTLFAFSTENWNRPDAEVQGLMGILGEVIEQETAQLHKLGVRIRHLGRTDRLVPILQQAISKATDLTKHNDVLALNVAFDYGGRDEILRAIQTIIDKKLDPNELDESNITDHLYTSGQPNPDLIIRTAGEMRLSNFLLWQSAYSEYYFTETLWPDFDEQEILKALDAYCSRKRRFGG